MGCNCGGAAPAATSQNPQPGRTMWRVSLPDGTKKDVDSKPLALATITAAGGGSYVAVVV